MTTSFYNGISGLKSFQSGIDIWGDNISNINTVGFKQKREEFATVFSSYLATPQNVVDNSVSYGSTVDAATMDLKEGSLVNTDNPFDMAISGEGFFGVEVKGSTFYTRNGSFNTDANGNLVNSDGAYLLVSSADNIVNKNGEMYVDPTVDTTNLLSKTPSPFKIPTYLKYPETKTTEVSLKANIQSNPLNNKPAPDSADFSALYDNTGEPIDMQNGDNFVFEAGDTTTYEDNLLKREVCIEDDKKDGQDYKLDLNINGYKLDLTLPDGATKSEILQAIEDKLKNQNNLPFSYQITSNGITFSSTDKLSIISNTQNINSSFAQILSYSHTPQNENEFKTISDLTNILNKDLSNFDATVSYEEGKIKISNNSNDPLMVNFVKTPNSNEKFLDNLGNLSSTISPHSMAQSAEFKISTQTVGGYIIDNGKQDLTFNFTKSEVFPNKTIWSLEIKENDNTIATTPVTFDSYGNLIDPKTITTQNPPLTINLNLTSYSKVNSAPVFTQNGSVEGNLQNYQIDESGNIIANFDNSKSVILGEIPIYHFQNPQGLDSIGSNLFTPTSNSNSAFLYTDANGNPFNYDKILSNKLETSNVNFSEAMTELIVNQKAYSAAAKTVTTSDEMIQKAINMKR